MRLCSVERQPEPSRLIYLRQGGIDDSELDVRQLGRHFAVGNLWRGEPFLLSFATTVPHHQNGDVYYKWASKEHGEANVGHNPPNRTDHRPGSVWRGAKPRQAHGWDQAWDAENNHKAFPSLRQHASRRKDRRCERDTAPPPRPTSRSTRCYSKSSMRWNVARKSATKVAKLKRERDLKTAQRKKYEQDMKSSYVKEKKRFETAIQHLTQDIAEAEASAQDDQSDDAEGSRWLLSGSACQHRRLGCFHGGCNRRDGAVSSRFHPGHVGPYGTYGQADATGHAATIAACNSNVGAPTFGSQPASGSAQWAAARGPFSSDYTRWPRFGLCSAFAEAASDEVRAVRSGLPDADRDGEYTSGAYRDRASSTSYGACSSGDRPGQASRARPSSQGCSPTSTVRGSSRTSSTTSRNCHAALPESVGWIGSPDRIDSGPSSPARGPAGSSHRRRPEHASRALPRPRQIGVTHQGVMPREQALCAGTLRGLEVPNPVISNGLGLPILRSWTQTTLGQHQVPMPMGPADRRPDQAEQLYNTVQWECVQYTCTVLMCTSGAFSDQPVPRHSLKVHLPSSLSAEATPSWAPPWTGPLHAQWRSVLRVYVQGWLIRDLLPLGPYYGGIVSAGVPMAPSVLVECKSGALNSRIGSSGAAAHLASQQPLFRGTYRAPRPDAPPSLAAHSFATLWCLLTVFGVTWQVSAYRQQRKQMAHSFEGILQFLQSFQLRLDVALQQSTPRAQPTPTIGIGAFVSLSGLLHAVTCLSDFETHVALGWIQHQSISVGVVCVAYCCFTLFCVLFLSAGVRWRPLGRPRQPSNADRP